MGIAGAVLQNPEILLVDEPTASLDPKTSRQIMRLIGELCRERALAAIINMHDVPLALMFVPRIIGLRQGEIVYDGSADDLTPERLTEIYGEEDWTATARAKERQASAAGDGADAGEDVEAVAQPTRESVVKDEARIGST